MDSDMWGIMTLREKVQELGYKKEDRSFAGDDSGGGSSAGEDSDWETGEYGEHLEDFEDSDYEQCRVDDQEFIKFTYPNVEYVGDGGLEIATQSTGEHNPIVEEVNLSDGPIPENETTAIVHIGESVRPILPPPNLPSPLWLGKCYVNKEAFKVDVHTYAVQFGKELKFKKNDKVRCVSTCSQEGCKWQVTCRKDSDEGNWRVSALNDEHSDCPWVNDNRLITARLVAKRWKKHISGNSTLKMSEFRETVCTEDRHSMSIRQAYKAMKIAKAEIKGEIEDNFNRIWSYKLEMEKTNPNSKCEVKLSDLECEGDANEGIFPIAYAIVEGENKDSWWWFLHLLKTDLQIDNISKHKYTFMSDKQKGLIPAFEEVLPMVSHRFCVRHLHANMKVAGFGGMAVRDALWKAARTTTVPTFSQAMRELKALDVQAFAWLGDKHPSTWSSSHFSTDVKSDVLVNNLCECFNAMILDARDSPLIHCLEIVRKHIMMRLFACRQQALKWNSKLCPNIAKKLEAIEEQAGGYWGIQSTAVLFEVKGAYDQHQVDLYAKTCSCRKWDLTGIPCRHVICVL
ncbi:PREDICTED: uncharacterized protein LOC109191598 [Ipomoea nil]|uniref:uncharacterized protein LOC109191598 n=1 Tax=Ipomoea nil TaxID=35883 RepID=UPI000901B94B|nr:PREDICTED: uncharacterized protein LOC109191598 [Ipomoea nil]